MVDYKVKCIEINGEKYGRYTSDIPISMRNDMSMTGMRFRDFESFADENQFPFPDGELNRVYEREEVEVIFQIFLETRNVWEDRNIESMYSYQFKGSKWDTRQIFRLSKPVEKEPEPIETVEDVAEKEFPITDDMSFNFGSHQIARRNAFKAGAEWQKNQQERK